MNIARGPSPVHFSFLRLNERFFCELVELSFTNSNCIDSVSNLPRCTQQYLQPKIYMLHSIGQRSRKTYVTSTKNILSVSPN